MCNFGRFVPVYEYQECNPIASGWESETETNVTESNTVADELFDTIVT